MAPETPPGTEKKKRFKDTYIPRLMPAGAAVILLMILIPILRQDRGGPAKLAAVEPPLAMKIYATGYSSLDTLLNDGLRGFGRGDYQEASRLLGKAHFLWTVKLREGSEEPYPEDLRFYLGLAEHYRGFPARGIPHLEDERRDNPYEEKYPWYLAHLYLAGGQTAKAREALERVAAIGGKHAAEASALLAKLPAADKPGARR